MMGECCADLVDEPVLAVCGFSGAGKTTLIEGVLPRLRQRGLAVAVVKHDAHGLDVDHRGKDSDRLFRAGADVLLQGPDETLVRRHGAGSFAAAIRGLLEDHDLVLVEGHKATPLAKLWLGSEPPPDLAQVVATLPPGSGREERLLALVEQRLAAAHAARPVLGGILIGGRSRRMGQPKQLMKVGGMTLLDRVARAIEGHVTATVLLGSGPVPAGWDGATRLPDPPGAAGPIAGLLAAMRWAPRAAWLLAACDLPRLDERAVAWLLDQRRPGRWLVLPSVDGVHPEAMLALYEPQAGRLVEAAARVGGGPSRPAGHRAAALVRVPASLCDCWRDADSLADLSG